MQDKLRALVRLAEIDASARHIDEQLSGIPVELEERKQAVEALEALVGGQTLQMDEAAALLSAQQEDLKMRSDMLARSRAKSAKARNMREADAAERELDAVRRSIKDGEAEKERLDGVIAETRKVLEEPMRELEEQKSALAESVASSDERLAELGKQSAEATRGREEFSAKVPKKVYRSYERIRHKIHPAVVEVIEGVCQGCRIHISPQIAIQLIRNEEFHQCLQCHRFLYLKDTII